MSKLRDDERAKRTIQEENDILLEIGKEGKEGDKLFKENAAEEAKQSEKKRNIVLNDIDFQKEQRLYNKYLADLLLSRLYAYADLTIGWKYQTKGNDKGVIMELKSPNGRIFRSAFTPTKNPVYDLNAIDNFAIRADNTIERVERQKYDIKT